LAPRSARLVDREEIRPDLVDVEPPVASMQAGESLEAAHVANLVGFVQTQGYLEQASRATVGSTGKDGPIGPLDLVPLTHRPAAPIGGTLPTHGGRCKVSDDDRSPGRYS